MRKEDKYALDRAVVYVPVLKGIRLIGYVGFKESSFPSKGFRLTGHWLGYVICPEVTELKDLEEDLRSNIPEEFRPFVQVSFWDTQYWDDIIDVHGGVTFLGSIYEDPCIGWDYGHLNDDKVEWTKEKVMLDVVEAHRRLEAWRDARKEVQ